MCIVLHRDDGSCRAANLRHEVIDDKGTRRVDNLIAGCEVCLTDELQHIVRAVPDNQVFR